MKYRVIEDFKDLRDGGHEYKAGDVYPHTGEADVMRAKHLMTPTSQRGALIEEVVEEVTEEVAEAVTEEVAEEATEPAPAKDKRKKKED